jgi:hypothetical protein
VRVLFLCAGSCLPDISSMVERRERETERQIERERERKKGNKAF